MNIEFLEHFQAIAQLKSISKVADKSHISQPALSQQMQKLEDAIGEKLFIRSNLGVKLTPAGELVLKYADNITRTYEKMLSELEKQQEREIKIEADATIATYCLPCALVKMKAKFPTHNYNLISNNSEKIEENVLNDICEVGFITNPCREKELISNIVIKEKVVLISPKNYNIASKIDLKEILNHPLIILKDKCIIKDNIKIALNDLGYSFEDLNVIAKLESREALKTLVKKGYGLGFIPYNAVEDEINKKLKISLIKDYSLDYNVFMINKKSNIINNETREFIQGFQELGGNVCY
ncbi:MAG: LysR family transcriptional regulator [bacterium]